MEKCMIAASLAVLLCHPNSNTKCSNSCKEKSPSTKKSQAKPKQKEQQSIRKSPLLKKPQKLKHLETTTMTHLKVVYNHLESNKYPPIQALEDILRRGWRTPSRLEINEVLKVKHEQGVVDKFEKYREIVKEKASKNVIVNKYYYNKLMENGFELLCFIGTELACMEKSTRAQRICKKRYCGVCQLIRVIESSSLDSLHSASVSESAWTAHQKVIKEGSGDKKAVIVCRVIAGNIANHRRRRRNDSCVKIGEDDKFDSVFVPLNDSNSHDELLVFNPCAILPCFVVLYDVEALQ